MPQFLSEEWVERFNAAVAGADVSTAVGSGSLAASSGTFSVGQDVTGGPDGTVRTVLRVTEGRVALERGDDLAPADVTISLGYADAVALSRGELEAGRALAEGRVRVRGDLSVLMAGQSVLAAAAGHLSGLSAETSY